MQDEKFKGRYQVADGYAGGSRPQTFVYYAGDLVEDMTDEELEREYETAAEDHFTQHIVPNVERVDEFIAWARAQLKAREDA